MFGYVRPVLAQLSEEDRDAYQAAYCGLCHAMGTRHGWLARFTLNYDFTFLAVLLYAKDISGCAGCMRCPMHPFRKPRTCLGGSGVEAAADKSLILTWHKLCDDVADHGFWRGLPYRLLRFAFRKSYRRAALERQGFDMRVRQGLERLRRLEEEESPELDRVADAFATILVAAGEGCPGGPEYQRAMEQLLYHLGRWIYLMDAWDDLEDDQEAGRYNALDSRFQGQAREEREYVETTATHSIRLAGAAANLMDLGTWTPIVENVLFSGLPAVQSAVLDGQWKELQKVKGRNLHERSV